MALDDMGYTDFVMEDERLADLASGAVNKLDSQLHVQFYKHAELNVYKSRPLEEGGMGRKIFDEHTYVRILAPANIRNVVERRATTQDIARFPKQYQAYEKGQTQLQTGTPLEELRSLSQAQVLELRHLKVETIEALAGMADTVVQLLGVGGPELKRRAQKYIDERTSSTELATSNRSLQEDLAAALARIAALEAGASAIRVTEGVAEKVPGPATDADTKE